MWVFQGVPLTIHSTTEYKLLPRWAYPGVPPEFLRESPDVCWHRSFLDACHSRSAQRLCFYRTFALGDILMLVPLARALRRTLGLPEPIHVIVQHRFSDLERLNRLQEDMWFRRDFGLRDYGCDLHIDLNSALEIDHRGGEASYQHRVALYARHLGLTLT